MCEGGVQDHCIAFVQCRDEDLLDIGKEAFGVDRPVQDKRRNQSLVGETGKKRRRLRMTVRAPADGACAASAQA